MADKLSTIDLDKTPTSPRHPIDCTKIKTIKDLALVLDSMNLFMREDCVHFNKLKHLIK